MSLASPPVSEYLAALAAEQVTGLIPAWASRPLYPWEVGTIDFRSIEDDQSVAYAATAASLDKVRDVVLDAMTAALGDGTAEQVAQELAAFGAKQPAVVRDAIASATTDIADALGITFHRAGLGLVADAERQGVHHGRVRTRPDLDARRAQRAAASVAPAWVWQRLNQTATAAGGPTAPGKAAVVEAARATPMDGGYDLARQAVHVAHGDGKAAAAKGLPEPERIYASELLDAATCQPCEQVDGKQYATAAEADADYPDGGYKSCRGGHRCRGTLVYVWPEDKPGDEGLLPHLPLTPTPPPVPPAPKPKRVRKPRATPPPTAPVELPEVDVPLPEPEHVPAVQALEPPVEPPAAPAVEPAYSPGPIPYKLDLRTPQDMQEGAGVSSYRSTAKERRKDLTLEQRARAGDQLRQQVLDATPTVATPSGVIDAILADGRYKGALEVKVKGATYDRARRGYENDFMGIARIPVAQRPIYGYMARQADKVSGAEWYGDVQAVLKPEVVKARATVTFGDSLNHGLPAFRYADLDTMSGEDVLDYASRDADVAKVLYGADLWPTDYTEFQVHGGLYTEDVDHWIIDAKNGELTAHQAATKAKLEAAGHTVVVKNPPMPSWTKLGPEADRVAEEWAASRGKTVDDPEERAIIDRALAMGFSAEYFGTMLKMIGNGLFGG